MWFYDIEHGREIERIADSHRRECFSMKCAQDGQSFVTGGVYGDVFIWDWATRRIRSRISVAIDQRKTPIAVSAEGTLIFACQMGPFTHDQFPSVQVWSSDASRPTADLGKVFWGSHVLACSPNGQWLAALSSLDVHHRRLHVWNVAGRERVRWLEGHGDKECWGVAFTPDGRTLVSSGDDHNARVWDLETRQQRQILHGHDSLTSCVAVDPTGQYWASGSYDNAVKLWSAVTGELVATLEGHRGAIRCVAFSPDGKRLASGAHDNRLGVWDVASRKPVATWPDFAGTVRCAAYSSDGKWLAAGSTDETLAIFDAATMKLHARITADDNVAAVAFTPDSKNLVYASEAGTIFIGDLATGLQVHKLLSENDRILALAISPDGATIAAGGINRTVYLWHRETRTELLRFDNLAGQINSLSFDPVGNTLAAALHDGSIALWEAAPLIHP